MNTRALLLFVVTALILLGGVWILESHRKGPDAPPPEATFTYELPQEKEKSHRDVMIRCMEEIMDAPSEAFAKWLNLQGIPLELPGGLMSISHLDKVTVDEELKPAQRAAVEVLKRYSPTRIVLVDHTECIYYDTVAAWNNDYNKTVARQEDNVRSAMKIVGAWFPNATISGYIAEKSEGKLVFRPVTPKEN